MSKIEIDVELLKSLVSGDDCDFDHRGGCQAHGYLSLEPDEVCPQAELKALIAEVSAGRKTPGEVAYVGYFMACGGKSLISGAELPSWDEQDPRIQAAWQAAAEAVREAL